MKNRAGFWSAMASNVTFQSRNVLSKKVMVKQEVTEISRLDLKDSLFMNLHWLLCHVHHVQLSTSIANS